jgi:hypothetical protein
MNVYASGHSAKAPSLALALALPGMLTAWLLHQGDVLGEVSGDGNPLAALGDVAQTLPGQPVALDASASFDPAHAGAALTYLWDFGDGAQASGPSVSHTYAAAGTYTLSLTVHSRAGGARQVRKALHVTPNAPYYPNPHDGNPPSGYPAPNPHVVLPTPLPG